MKIKRILYSQKAAPFLFVLPFLLSFLVFWIYPLFSTVKMSFQNILPGQIEWVGFENYAKLLKDTTFHTAIRNSFVYMIFSIALLIPFPMLFAVLMDSNLVKAKGFFKGVLYVPALTSVVISGTLFRLMFSELPTGQMNLLMDLLGKVPVAWLKEKNYAMCALLVLCCWRWTGVNMLYFLSGLKSIDTNLYEAASIDGASPLMRFRYITIPLLKPTTVYVLTISVYAGLAMFLESFMLWAGNASPKNIGLTIVGYLYKRGIEKNQMGYASAVGLVLLGIALLINVAQLILNGTFKKEEN
ncbi:sugar ABC transporter permease [Clostridium sp. E02]|uniref:carbohydrate ABC transporter permease n=1 Tax=Clostridium sp. E02 TaxID=2487134 RepID=UPI000F548B92|nr:sugar ABC transporter permease [Clostridium sp. E02]